MATLAQRQHGVHVMEFMAAHAAHMLYPVHDIRTAKDNHDWHLTEQQMEHVLNDGGYWQGDCTDWDSYVLKCAGLWRWSQPGWTGSHLDLFPDKYTDGKLAGECALVVMGLAYNRNGVHEAIVEKPDHKHGDPIVKSHGRPGMDTLRVSQIAVGHLAGHVYLNISHL